MALFPLISLGAGKTLKDIASLFVEYLNIGIELIIALAVVTFVWNVYRYFFTEQDRAQAGMYVMYSIIGFFVILSFWGMVALVKNSIKLDDARPDFKLFGGSTTNTNTNTTPVKERGPIDSGKPDTGPISN